MPVGHGGKPAFTFCFRAVLTLSILNPEFIHYKPRIAVAILDLQWMKMT